MGSVPSNFPIAKTETLDTYAFMDLQSLEAIRENLGNQPITAGDFDRIKFPSSGSLFWQITDLSGELTPVKSIVGIVLYHKVSRVYWASEYSGEKIPPDCNSQDGIEGKGAPGGNCMTCPFSQWDSDPKGGGGQACKQVGINVVAIPGEVLPVIVPVPPTSLKPVKKFMLNLSSKKLKYSECIISFGLEATQNKGGMKYSIIKPILVAVLPDEAKEQIRVYKKQFVDAFTRIEVVREEAVV
jgi:hypothetical protein